MKKKLFIGFGSAEKTDLYTQEFYACDEYGKIFECYAEPFCEFCILKDYRWSYYDEWKKRRTDRPIYALPHERKPYKIYRGLDRESQLLYLFTVHNYKYNRYLKRYRTLAKHLKHGDFITNQNLAEEYYAIFNEEDEYELAYAKTTNFAGNAPEGFDFVGYDICYRPMFSGAFSMICDCMFLPRWHGCDEEGTLFADDFAKLNGFGLFDNTGDARRYIYKYLSQEWAELGDYFILEIYVKNLEVYE